ncbi:putative polyhydroxyalkanoic acid system protein [Sphingomonas sp. EC-HK361]|uniref:polyhydroxyalkanoic acid system family protein n=1 Tax=Sphingomonas sp. EC-HK361 TaxID=2038397 RepID=UPI001251B5B3|nr:polyhydroxyalkanoic acid system family protein [Sphingomonas sp. EC-HK361]VVT13164.1 putative polyhydroxyalkanoic acid system protein [Sphingomonas sp. EC-HK361]
MTVPIEVDLPHKLGRDEAKRRIGGGFGRLAEFVPGGAITEHRWDGDVLEFVVEGMGQRVAARLDVADTVVHARFELPAFMALFADKIRAKLQREGPKLLE